MFRSILFLLAFGFVTGSVPAQSITNRDVAAQGASTSPSAKTPIALINVDFDNVLIASAIHNIGDRSGADIKFSAKSLPDTRVTYRASNVSVETALSMVLKGTGFRAEKVRDGSFKIVRSGARAVAGSAQGIITGRITDARTGASISRAAVSLNGESRSVTSGEDGSYRITGVASGTHIVTVRLIGFAKQSRSVTVGDGATTAADFKLEPSTNVLSEVVVTGTVIPTEIRAVPNAITVVTAKEIEDRGITRIDQLFRGDVPGLFSMNYGSFQTADEVSMFSRGATALDGSRTPIKTYVDGIELADPKYLNQIDPRSIEKVEIISGPQASTIYGSAAINGVMQIFTKRGATSRPQLSASLKMGWIQNNFSSAITPNHDHSARVNGMEGIFSYNLGGSYEYVGPWTPSQQRARNGLSGGLRMQHNPRLSTDITTRFSQSKTYQRGFTNQTLTVLRERGYLPFVGNSNGLAVPTTIKHSGQTFGGSVQFTPYNWWSHNFIIGRDESVSDTESKGRGYSSQSDTNLSVSNFGIVRRSAAYNTTAQINLADMARLSITLGADKWNWLQSVQSSFSTQSTTGTIASPSVSRFPWKNSGAFTQLQLGIRDALFLTYGLRAEWNPRFGDDVQPNMAPRFGASYSRELGFVTAKLRGSYGRATRPPGLEQKDAKPQLEQIRIDIWGPWNVQRENPELLPEHQQGGEGGIELYFGRIGSFVVTRYNQTVDNVTALTLVDSVKSILPATERACGIPQPNGHCYDYIRQYLNIGNIRNQGWELQGSVNTGPFTTRGTYSWNKSRVIGITQKWRNNPAFAQSGQYTPGASFNLAPEHTAAVNIQYAKAATTIGLSTRWISPAYTAAASAVPFQIDIQARLIEIRHRMIAPINYRAWREGYAEADLNASHRFSRRLEGVLNVHNLTDQYQNDWAYSAARMGRQTKVGLRITQ